ncbi:MAG: hypothetical protein IJ766_00135 [Clostridia bacterium]|nr:hypothetical protein [Clostridia bacterium]
MKENNNEVILTVRIEENLYNKVMTVITPLGFTMEQILITFLQETVRLGDLPFPYTQEDIQKAKKMGGVEAEWSI